jgi:CRP/FNR family cyclic AMP-dependent transcriptional regulator
MNTPVLTIDERHNIEAGAWFSRLSQPLRNAILSRAVVKRLSDGAPLASRGTPPENWCGVARGAVRISSVSLSGKQVTLTYAEPGTWFGDIALFDGLPRTHDADTPMARPRCWWCASPTSRTCWPSTWSCTTPCCA